MTYSEDTSHWRPPEKTTTTELAGTDEDLRAKFFALRTARDVADLLDVPYPTLIFYTYRGRDHERYKQFEIPKRRGGTRSICAPTVGLRIIQQKLNQVLRAVYQTKPAVHGFVRDKNILSNAYAHRRKRFVFNVDLADFFPSINLGRVRGMFMAKPYSLPAAVANILTRICCFENQLPQGAPTSPMVSNMLCGRLDADLTRLAQRFKANYTRYADDLTFSTNERTFPRALAARDDAGHVVAGRELERVIRNNGFEVNAAKTRLLTPDDRQEVTGLVVNKKVNVSRRFVRTVRAMLHRALNEDSLEAPFIRQLKGRIDFIGQVRGRGDGIYRRFLQQLARAVPGVKVPPAPTSEFVEAIDSNVWVVEWLDGSNCEQGTAVLIRDVGFMTCAHCVGPNTHAYRASDPKDERPVKVLFTDIELDLALIAIEGVSIQDGDGLVLSDIVPTSLQRIFVAGFPDFAPGATLQIHSTHLAGQRVRDGVPLLSVGASVFAGSSGGPVVNETGAIVGIAVRGAKNEAGADETSWYGAIPAEKVREFITRMRNDPDGVA